jgi:hypothetical protein
MFIFGIQIDADAVKKMVRASIADASFECEQFMYDTDTENWDILDEFSDFYIKDAVNVNVKTEIFNAKKMGYRTEQDCTVKFITNPLNREWPYMEDMHVTYIGIEVICGLSVTQINELMQNESLVNQLETLAKQFGKESEIRCESVDEF